MKFLKLRRMCGGGLWSWAYPFNGFRSVRKVDGAIIWDWPGIALAWRGGW